MHSCSSTQAGTVAAAPHLRRRVQCQRAKGPDGRRAPAAAALCLLYHQHVVSEDGAEPESKELGLGQNLIMSLKS